MKVYFIKDVEGVAKVGDIKDVASGYWRNYLNPRKLAQMATEKVIKEAEAKKAHAERQIQENQQKLKGLQHSLEGFILKLKAKASPEGKLFGGIGAGAISEALAGAGKGAEGSTVQIEHSIKDLGSHKVLVKLPHGLTATINVVVEKE